MDFSINRKLFHTFMFNYTHSFVHSFDKSVDDVSLRRMRDKYLCRVSDTFVYLAPCLTSPSSYSSTSVLFYCLIKIVSKCRVYTDYLYTALSFNIQTKEWLTNMEILTFWKIFSFNSIIKNLLYSEVMQAAHHYRIREGERT